VLLCCALCAQGLVFAVATESGIVKLYDVRSYDKGPFDAFTVGVRCQEMHAATLPCGGCAGLLWGRAWVFSMQ
jgi:hypothetical protein